MGAGVADVVQAAADGSQSAWDDLVDRYAGLVWSVCRAHRLSQADAADVSQTVWLRLVEHLHRLRDPERVGSWLATTARHECYRVLRVSGRQVPTPDDDLDGDGVAAAALPRPEEGVLRDERDRLLWQALTGISPRCQALLRLLLADPPPSYEDVSAALDMPVGSIGPTRARCLERLRAKAEAAGITATAGDS